MPSIKKEKKGNNQEHLTMSALRDSPDGGLYGIRARNGWDDTQPPVISDTFRNKSKTMKELREDVMRSYNKLVAAQAAYEAATK